MAGGQAVVVAIGRRSGGSSGGGEANAWAASLVRAAAQAAAHRHQPACPGLPSSAGARLPARWSA